MKCQQCGADLGGHDKAVASICVRVRGDEETRSYFLCTACNVYSAWVWIEEFFTDKDTLYPRGPIPKEKGDAIVDKIRRCPAPDLMSCHCPTHEEMSCWPLADGP